MSEPIEIMTKLLDEAASLAGVVFATWAFARIRKARRDINAAFQKIRGDGSEVAAPLKTPPTVATVAHDASGIQVDVGEVTVRILVSTTAPTPAGPSAPEQTDDDREPEPATAA